MTTKLKLTTITLMTEDGQQIALSLAEAKDLHEQLHELFGPKFAPQVPIVIERDRPWPVYPLRWDTPTAQPAAPGFPPIVWCQSKCDSGITIGYGGTTTDGGRAV